MHIEDDWKTLSVGDRIEISLKIDDEDFFMRMVNHFYAELDLNVTRINWNKELFDPDLGSFEFFVGPVPVVFTNSFDLELSVDSETSLLSFSTYATVNKSFGFEYSSASGLRSVDEDNSYSPEFELNPEGELFSGSFEAALTATLGSRLYGFAGPDLAVALKSIAKADLQKINSTEDNIGAITIPLFDWKLKGRLSEKITVPISGRFKLEIPEFNPFTNKDSIELADMEIFDTDDLVTLLELNWEFGSVDRSLEGKDNEDSGVFPAGMSKTFIFASGAGAWDTVVNINSDGTFEGYYHDSNAGESGAGYDSTRYESHFQGRFTDITKVSDFEYSMQVEGLEVVGTIGDETIDTNRTLVVITEPYGFNNAGEFRL